MRPKTPEDDVRDGEVELTEEDGELVIRIVVKEVLPMRLFHGVS